MEQELALAKGASRARRRNVAVFVSAFCLMAGMGVGYAAWTASGGGPVQARSTSTVALTVAVATGAADLYPGGSGAVYFTVTNPNAFPVTLTAASFTAVTPDDATACPASNVTTTNKTGLTITVAAGATSATQSIGTAVAMVAGAPDGCQGRTFSIAATLTGSSS